MERRSDNPFGHSATTSKLLIIRDILVKIQYSPALDGLRALCIIFTLFNHIEGSPWFINWSVGVDVFFALSGFQDYGQR